MTRRHSHQCANFPQGKSGSSPTAPNPQLGQNPRPLPENDTRRSTRANGWLDELDEDAVGVDREHESSERSLNGRTTVASIPGIDITVYVSLPSVRPFTRSSAAVAMRVARIWKPSKVS